MSRDDDPMVFARRWPALITVEETDFYHSDPDAALDAAEARVEEYQNDGKAAHIISRPGTRTPAGDWFYTVRAYLPSSSV
ncbi:MAG: hypothetical protein FJ399_08615 [Verrucomicrobia bacterium]|nr:hypothetical protein [Verrucomicrobiota bacterium]